MAEIKAEEYKEDAYVTFLESQRHIQPMPPGKFSDEYLNFVKFAKENNIQLNFTNTQHQFAEWCLIQRDVLNQLGDLESVFKSVRRYIRKQNK